jgi:putative flippase GtrA
MKTNPLWTAWKALESRHPQWTEFLVFFLLSNGITVLQLILMPLFKGAFEATGWAGVPFQTGAVGQNADGSPYYMFDYAAGTTLQGGGGGLAYFLAVQVTLAIAQVINFYAQRNITFKSKVPVLQAALWYLLAYVVITVGAAALQGLYKAPLYRWIIHDLGMGAAGDTLADLATMMINCTLSFWVYFPVLKFIFQDNKAKRSPATAGPSPS